MQQMEAIRRVVEANGDQALKLEFSQLEKMIISKSLIEEKVLFFLFTILPFHKLSLLFCWFF